MFVCSLQGLLLLFFDKQDYFATKNEEIYYPTIKNVLTLTNSMSDQLFTAALQPRAKRYFYKGLSNVT